MSTNLLSIEEIKKRHPELFQMTEEEMLSEIKLASFAYYNGQNAVMSDERFDSMEIVFKNRFPNNKEIFNVGSELNETDNKIKGFGKHKHTRLAGKTQHKAKNIIELEEELRLKKIKDEEFTWSLKLDGISLYSIYNAKTGELEKVVTRGTGIIGDDITENAKNILSIIKKIDTSKYLEKFPNAETIEIRGEGIILNHNFNKLKSIYEKEGKELSNARNAAAGIVRRLDGKFIEYVDFMPYEEIIELNDNTIIQKDENIVMETLEDLGFSTPTWGKVSSIEKMNDIYQDYINNSRKKLRNDNNGYEIDGIVIKVNKQSIQKELGMSNKRQNGQVAIKFPPEIAISKLLDIEWSESFTGIITPVALIEPTYIGGINKVDENGNFIENIGGVLIQRISLANNDVMNNLLLSIGDNVEISRRNDVIPKIERNLKLEDIYINYHKYVHQVLFPQIDKTILETPNEKLKDYLTTFKENISMEISVNMFQIESKINDIIRDNLFNEDGSKKTILKTDKEIISSIYKEFTSFYYDNLKKFLNKEEKKLASSEEIRPIISKLFSNIKEEGNKLLSTYNKKSYTINNSNENNVSFITNCPTCGSALVSENSNILCNNSSCANLLKGKIGLFIKNNKDLIVATELQNLEKFLSNPNEYITLDNYKKDLGIEIVSLEAEKIWKNYEKTNNLQELKKDLTEEAKKAGIGESTIKELFEKSIAKEIKDLFFIKKDDFVIGKDSKNRDVFYEGWGERRISNLIKDINKLRNLTDVQLLSGLNFKNMSVARFLKLLQNFKFKDILEGKITKEDITSIDSFGDKITEQLLKDFENKKDTILDLLEIIKIKETPIFNLTADEKITFVITGKVEPLDQENPSENWLKLEEIVKNAGFKMDRTGLTKYLKSIGHTVSGSVSNNTDYLINIDKESSSSKNKKAKSLEVEIIEPEKVAEIILNKEQKKEIKKNETIIDMSPEF